MAVNSKQKGNRTELQLAKILTQRFNKEFKRTPMSGAWGTANQNSNIREDAVEVLSGDIMCPDDFKFSIECKSRQDFNFWDLLNDDNPNLEILEWLHQVEDDAFRSNKYPLLYIKINRRKPFVLIPKELYTGKITYDNYTIIRFDYFLQFDDKFFFEE